MIELIVGMLTACIVMIGAAMMFQTSIFQYKSEVGVNEIVREWENGKRLLLNGSSQFPGMLAADMATWTDSFNPPHLEYHVGAPWNATYVVCIATSNPIPLCPPNPPDEISRAGQLVRFQLDPPPTFCEALLGNPPPPKATSIQKDGVAISRFLCEVLATTTARGNEVALASMTFHLFYNLSRDVVHAADNVTVLRGPIEDTNEMYASLSCSIFLRKSALVSH